MMQNLTPALVLGMLLTIPVCSRAAELPANCRAALGQVQSLTSDAAAQAVLEAAISAQITKLSKPSWAPGYCRAVADNFASKVQSRREGVSFTTQSLISTAVEFEAFRITSFRNSA